ncbi:Extended-spectrum beta-lactamase PER-1 precursor [Tsuneonella dongtanensis]|uniref:Beta-lactamase n=1 Tax=Tsuneonella dongtanensis TaxID=692370 RepID=A0A1B2A9D4_9SPHN|nr:serine hydrolase [Tsuneonella dongtanensis]ANY18721.1 Extended-spectrum beta-lactamase PER-1 precursor [Tsuneonella dongtanensis]
MALGRIARLGAAIALGLTGISSAHAAESNEFNQLFDAMLGTEVRKPQSFDARYDSPLSKTVAQIADGSAGRIGVYAVDLATGREVSVLGDQRFPMASTSKIAIAATFLEGVEKGRWSLTSEFPLMVPVASPRFSSSKAPVRPGQYMKAIDLIEIMITRSSNPATDALLAVVGGPAAVNNWASRNGISDFNITRDIATLVRDDGEVDPAQRIDVRDSATPQAMVQLLAGLYQGKFLKESSRNVILGAMERCRTGTRRIPGMLPDGARVAHKTGTLSNTASDIGIIHTPDGRAIAVAIYVTGQGSKPARDAKIASIARALYDGYQQAPARAYANATY